MLGLLLPISLCGQHRMEVVVSGVTSSEGNVLVALYREASSFPKFEKVFRVGKAHAATGDTKVVLEDLEPGGDTRYWRDEEGVHHVPKRGIDELIISGGFNVYPQEVINCLVEHPSVCEAAVIGVPDQRRGELVKAYVVTAAGHSVSGQELTD